MVFLMLKLEKSFFFVVVSTITSLRYVLYTASPER